jgi:hypothetical protein
MLIEINIYRTKAGIEMINYLQSLVYREGEQDFFGVPCVIKALKIEYSDIWVGYDIPLSSKVFLTLETKIDEDDYIANMKFKIQETTKESF